MRTRTSLADRVVYGIVLLLVLGGLAVKPAWGALDPGVTFGSHGDWPSAGSIGVRDPWGNPYVSSDQPGSPFRVWSVGPNGVDERGRGDDVELTLGWQRDLYGTSTELALFLAGILAGAWELRRMIRFMLAEPRAETLGPELMRAGVLAIFLATLLGTIGYLALGAAKTHTPGVVDAVEENLLVPLPFAIGGLAYLLAFGFFLWQRLRAAPATPSLDGADELRPD